MIRFVEMQPSFTAQDEVAILALLQQMDIVQSSIRSYSAQLAVTESATGSWPRVTKELNVAKRRLQTTMANVIARYDQSEGLIQELKQALFDLLKRGSPDGNLAIPAG